MVSGASWQEGLGGVKGLLKGSGMRGMRRKPWCDMRVSKQHTIPIVDLVLGHSIRDMTERRGRSLELPSLLLRVVSVGSRTMRMMKIPQYTPLHLTNDTKCTCIMFCHIRP